MAGEDAESQDPGRNGQGSIPRGDLLGGQVSMRQDEEGSEGYGLVFTRVGWFPLVSLINPWSHPHRYAHGVVLKGKSAPTRLHPQKQHPHKLYKWYVLNKTRSPPPPKQTNKQ